MGKHVESCDRCNIGFKPELFLKSSPTSWRTYCKKCFNHCRSKKNNIFNKKRKNGNISLSHYAKTLVAIKNYRSEFLK